MHIVDGLDLTRTIFFLVLLISLYSQNYLYALILLVGSFLKIKKNRFSLNFIQKIFLLYCFLVRSPTTSLRKRIFVVCLMQFAILILRQTRPRALSPE